ncbi:hypothetical protein TNCV_2959671 [Trichonephila clavipes]|nr:hypothetical protein TNCV_2959671 [Trichonephila clavipes]
MQINNIGTHNFEPQSSDKDNIGPHNFEPRSSDKNNILASISSELPHHADGKTLSLDRFNVCWFLYTEGLQWH